MNEVSQQSLIPVIRRWGTNITPLQTQPKSLSLEYTLYDGLIDNKREYFMGASKMYVSIICLSW